jgi:cytochrome c oxidase cbb3-type subunit 3
MQAAEARYEPIYERFAAMEFAERVADPEALELGRSLFANYCTTCHGSDARGGPGYPNLTDDDWQWGNSEDNIVATITHGRNGIMTSWAAVLGSDEGIDNMVRYVRSLSGLEEADAAALTAKPTFETVCAACHTPAGTGNTALGAPDLTDATTLYGSSPESIRTTIVDGRNGVMPPHGELLGEKRTKILAAYVFSLSNSE